MTENIYEVIDDTDKCDKLMERQLKHNIEALNI